MATEALITREQYLATHTDRETELVHGELVERPLPTRSHGRTQQRLAVLDRAGYCCTEVRMRLAEDLYRIPEVAVFEGSGPAEEIPTTPPMLIVEISSPEDRFQEMFRQLEEYRAWVVQHIWLVEPELKRCHIYENGSLTEVSRFTLPQFGLEIAAAELFA